MEEEWGLENPYSAPSTPHLQLVTPQIPDYFISNNGARYLH